MKNQLKEKENLFCVKKTIIIIVSVIFAIAAIFVYERNFSGRRKSNDFQWDVYSIKGEPWWESPECVKIADEITECQKPDGGWTKDIHNTVPGPWDNSTIDNYATWGQIRFLAKCYCATGNTVFRESCRRGIAFLLGMQYEYGGWPQIVGTTDYHAHITFNDNAMTGVMETLKLVSERSEKDGFSWVDDDLARQSAEAFDRGLKCILRCQIKVDEKLTAWCQQYNEVTLEPTGGRTFEPPSICTKESVGIVLLLKSIRDPSPEVENSIRAAEEWFDKVKIEGCRFEWVGGDRKVVKGDPDDLLWARLYRLDGLTPLFSDRDGKIYDDVSEISKERRTGYDWYGTWPLQLYLYKSEDDYYNKQ